MSRQVVTRFAPSPTGMLHIGGVRTALFCWLFARRHGGRFILRIEDTDLSRSTDDNIRIIEEGMAWCGLDWDEGPVMGDPSQWKGPHGPYRQMQRMDLYQAKIQELLDKDLAYRCRCSREAMEERRRTAEAAGKVFQYNRGVDARKGCAHLNHDASQPAAIRFRMPEVGDILVPDLIKGDTRFPADSLDDWIIARTGDGPGEIGVPTYNFCVVVDDTHMDVTHVIRGDDHLNNTPKQIPLFEAFGYDLPAFAHVPMILGADGAKLSKRHGATSITEYQAMGLLPSAVRLALARLSWTPKIDGRAVESAEEELLSDEQMIQLFDLADCQKSAARFDMDKLQWLNQKLIQRASWQELEPHLRPFVAAISKGAWATKPDAWKAQAIHATQKGKSLTDMAEALRFAFERPATFDEKAVEKFLTPAIKPALREVAALTDYGHYSPGLANGTGREADGPKGGAQEEHRHHSPGLANRTGREADGPKGGAQEEHRHEALETAFTGILERHGLKTKDLAQALRVALCGKPVSPGIYDTLMLVGRDEVVLRLERWL